jgi:hypothetical protein
VRAARLAPILLLAAGCGPAPVLEDYSYARAYGGEARLRAEVDYAAGRLRIGPARDGGLFEMHLQYDGSRFRPIGEVTPAGTVRLGTEMIRRGGIRIGRRRALPQTAEIGFAREAGLDLAIRIGAAEADLDLGGLRLERLRLATGASRSRLRFAEPNPASCDRVEITSGAGELTIHQAGNSGCATWTIEGGVGKVTVDLDGAWRGDPRMNLNLAVGGVVLEAPRATGIRVKMAGVVSRFDGEGFTREDRTWTSAGFDQKTRKVDIEVRSAVGGVRVEWKERPTG